MIQSEVNWYKILSVAQSKAAGDVELSNKILEISDMINVATQDGTIEPEKKKEILKMLIETALNLSEDSKEINFAVAKLVNAV